MRLWKSVVTFLFLSKILFLLPSISLLLYSDIFASSFNAFGVVYLLVPVNGSTTFVTPNLVAMTVFPLLALKAAK